ncbi:MAG: glycosyltransferase family 4 protein [Geminicoccaceae bacterium]|nr:glycosyltransferase family 4 protein [Geminicoccaceae bacterium]
MRVAFLTNNRFPPREGIARHIAEIALRLRARGIDSIILSPGSRFGRWQRRREQGIEHLRYPYWKLRPFHHAMIRPLLQRWLDEGAGGANIVHLHLPLLPPLETGRKLVVTVHSPLLTDTAAIPERDLRARLTRLNAKWISAGYEQKHLDRADRIIAVSGAVARELDANYRSPPAGIETITNGVDTRFFTFSPTALRNRHVLFAGRLGYRKGLFRLLDAMVLLDDPRIRLEIAGEGPLETALRRHVRRLGLADRVLFHGFLDRNRLRETLRRVGCLVNPADYETGPLSLLEAMSAGTPVVSTATGLAVEMGPNAPMRVVETSAFGLARGIGEVFADGEASRERAEAARRVVEQRFEWELIVDRLAGIYREPVRCAA